MGIGDSWGTREELLHPRDRHGRFRSKWKMAAGVIDAILKALGSFNPKTFGSDAEAGQYLFNKAKPTRFRGGSEHKMLVGFEQANKNLRAGSIDPDTKKFVKVMDESAIDLPDDIIVSKVVGPEAFGLTPETMGAEEGGIEDFTGKLIGDRGYNSTNIGTPMRKQPGQIEMRVAVPKGTRAILPATSRGDREVILDKDQEVRVTKVEPDGQGGFFVLAVAQPRTPGETPKPVGAPASAPGAPQAQAPGVVQSDNAPDPRAMVQAPGAPPPRVEPEVTPAIGAGPAQPNAPGTAAVPGVESTPAVVPEAPPTPRLVDIRAAVREANLPVPSRGKRRADWNSAYMALGNARNPKDPVDVLRELDRDIEHWKGSLASSTATGHAGDDPDLPGDIDALEQLRDLIREQYDIPGPPRAKKAAPTQKERNAEIRKETRSRPTPEPDVAQIRRREEAETKARVQGERQEAEDQATNAKIQQLMAPILEKAGVNEGDLGDLDRTGFLVVGGLLQKRRITRVEAARRLRTDRDSPLNKIADALEAPRASKAVPAKKAVPEAPAKPLTAAEARIQAALDAAKAKPITGTEGHSYRGIVKGLEDGDLTPAAAAKRARDTAKHHRKEAGTVSNFSRPGESGMDVERRKAAVDRVNALADRYDKLADDIKASQTPPAKKAAPAKAAPEAPAAPGDDLDSMLKTELVQEARRVGVTNASSMTKPQLKDAIREGRNKPATLAVRVPEVDAALALPQVPKSRVQNGDIAVWQAPGAEPMVGRVVDEGPRKKFIDWNGGRREKLSLNRSGPNVTFHREGAAPAKKAAPVKAVSVAATADREVELEDRIRAAYRAVLADENKSPGDWIGLAELREKLGADIPRNEVDDAIRRLNIQDRGTSVVPESNQKTLRPIDRESAVSIGNQNRHVIAIDDPSPRGAGAPPAAPTPAKIGSGVSSVRINPGDKIWIGEDESGNWGPTKKKSGSLQLTVGKVERVQVGNENGYRFHGVDQNGYLRTTKGTYGQNAYQRVEGGDAPAPVKAAKAAVPGAAPGTAAGKLTAARITPGTKILVGVDVDGNPTPTNRRTGSAEVTVLTVDRVTGDTTSAGSRSQRSRLRISVQDIDGNKTSLDVTPSQTFIVRSPTPDAIDPPSFPDNDGAPVDMGRALRRNERNEMADLIDTLLADGANVDGFDDKLGGRGSVKDNLETMRDELRGSKKMTPGDVGIVTNSIFHRLGLGKTTSAFREDQERVDIELRNLLASRLPAITAIPAGPNTPAGKAARTKVDGPKVDAPVVVPDRKKTFREAFIDTELNLGGSAGRQVHEVVDDIEAGKLTPAEGIRRLETEIAFNQDELDDMDRAMRELIGTGSASKEQRRILQRRRDQHQQNLGEQKRANEFLRRHFAQEPATTTDTIVIELPQELRDSLDKATIQDLKQTAKISGLREPKGRTKKAVLDDIIKQMAAKELESRGLGEKVAPPKAPDKPKPTPTGAKYERIDLHALAEGLPLNMRQEERMFKHFQELLDDEKMTPSSIAKEMDATGQRAFYWPAVVNKQVGVKTIYPEMDAVEADRIQAHNAEVMDETKRLIAKGDAWKELTERVRKIRRKSAGSAPPPAPEPKLTAPEKAEIKKVAELVDIPAPTLAKKALAKKQADAPPSAKAQQITQTLDVVSDREAADKILKGRTKPELVDIAKAAGVPVAGKDTKATLIQKINDAKFQAPTPSSGGRTRADLEQMTVPELKDLEDELGIVRTSLNRQDRIDAILAKGGGAPAAPDLEEAARTRQADIDNARKIGNAAGEWDQILDAGASPQAMVARLRAAEARDGIDLSRIIQSVEEGNMQQARIRMQTLIDQAGLIKRGNAGKIQQYHAASDQLLPGQSIGPSGRVRVIRPGYSLRRDGKLITLSRPVVEPADEPDAPSAPAAPKMSSKPIIENTWGGRTTEVHFHADGVIGYHMDRLGPNKKLEVEGDALQNVLGKLATQLVMGEITGDQLVTRLRALAAKLPEGRAKNTVAGMADEIDAPQRGPIKIPDLGDKTAILQKLMDDLLKIPLARGGSKANRQDFNEVDELVKLAGEFTPTRSRSALLGELRRRLLNRRHESMEGKISIDRAIERAMAELRG